MPRLRIELQYDGTDFSGWQIQPNASSVQEAFEQALARLNGNEHVELVGCGRTDAGVHAKHYVAHCDLNVNDTKVLFFKLNSMLPRSISVLSIELTNAQFHARFDASKRTYRYFINKNKNPFQDRYAYYLKNQLDIAAMNHASEYLLGRQDFESFAKQHSDVRNHYCHIFSAQWTENEEQYIFEITANRFLRNMVRAIVGTLLEVGLGKNKPSHVATIIAEKNRGAAGSSVPGKGLFLWNIEYPETINK
jgi:tRNA pseudouridine38-40 synthase